MVTLQASGGRQPPGDFELPFDWGARFAASTRRLTPPARQGRLASASSECVARTFHGAVSKKARPAPGLQPFSSNGILPT